jgi:putative peptidoglycan lipid II flippase
MTLKHLFSAGALITAGMLAGRLLGLLREMLLASQFGIHAQADMAIMLLIIPDFITAALIGSAASAALIPAFAERDHDNALALFWQSLALSLIVFTLIGLLMFMQEDHLRALMSAEVRELPQASLAFFLTLCSLPLAAATSIVTAYLQYRGRFMAPAFANAIFNFIIILTLCILPGSLAVFAGGIVVAAVVRLVAHVGAFARVGDTLKKPVWSPLVINKSLGKTYASTVGAGVFGMLPFYTPYVLIAYMGSSVALFNYAFKLIMLPAALLQTVVQMVLLPYSV